MEAVTIRTARPNDSLAVSRLLAKSWKFAYLGIVNDEYLASLKDDHWVAFLQSGLSNGTVECILAEKAHLIIGASIIRKSLIEQYPEDGEMVALYLLPDIIGTGVGHILYASVGELLRKKHYSHCALAVLAENRRAIQFYKAHGFEPTFYSTPTTLGNQELVCLIMRKAL